jgi:hypothetical protein
MDFVVAVARRSSEDSTSVYVNKSVPFALGLSFALLAVGCKGAEVAGIGSSHSGGRTGSNAGGTGGEAPASGGFDAPAFDLGNGGDAVTATPPPITTCGEQSARAMQVPLTLMLVVDASSSMLTMAGTSSKYDQVRQALEQFVGAPGSAGIALGLGFFPQPGAGSACSNDLDCGYQLAPTPPPCQLTSVCAKTVSATGVAKLCGGGRNGGCPADDTCVPLGRCAVTFDDCTNIGQPCAGQAAGDNCLPVGKTCEYTDEQTCAVAAYENLPVPIVPLPDPGQRLVARAFARRSPSGATPMRPAIDGALAALKKHLDGHPGQKSILVLATDGSPVGCTQNTVADVASLLQSSHNAGVSTYVIGVATPNNATELMTLGQLASAGGTGMPYVISATEILSQRFLETLNQIRGQALPCEFTIPKPSTGAIDFGKVNVSWHAPGAREDVLYTATAARCDATRGGWYYDVDPATGGTPTRVIVCEATCRQLKMHAEATVDLRFGCATRTID